MRLKHSLILAFLLIGNAAFGQHIELPKNFKKTEDATKMVFTWQKRDNEDDYEIEIWLDICCFL